MKFTKNCTQSVEGEAGREPVWEAVKGFWPWQVGRVTKRGWGRGLDQLPF